MSPSLRACAREDPRVMPRPIGDVRMSIVTSQALRVTRDGLSSELRRRGQFQLSASRARCTPRYEPALSVDNVQV